MVATANYYCSRPSSAVPWQSYSLRSDHPRPILPLSQSRYGDMACETLYVRKHVECARVLENRAPDAVLLDVQLGNEDGLSLAAWIRQQPKLCRIPVIAVTVHAMVTEQQRFLEAGCNACVSKPVNSKFLSEQLDR